MVEPIEPTGPSPDFSRQRSEHLRALKIHVSKPEFPSLAYFTAGHALQEIIRIKDFNHIRKGSRNPHISKAWWRALRRNLFAWPERRLHFKSPSLQQLPQCSKPRCLKPSVKQCTVACFWGSEGLWDVTCYVLLGLETNLFCWEKTCNWPQLFSCLKQTLEDDSGLHSLLHTWGDLRTCGTSNLPSISTHLFSYILHHSGFCYISNWPDSGNLRKWDAQLLPLTHTSK